MQCLFLWMPLYNILSLILHDVFLFLIWNTLSFHLYEMCCINNLNMISVIPCIPVFLLIYCMFVMMWSSVVQTEECMDAFDFEMAGLFCQRALDMESDNLQALNMLGHICSELGNTQKAKEISFIKVSFLLLCACISCFCLLDQVFLSSPARGRIKPRCRPQ